MNNRVRNLHELARFEDSISYLYVEHAVIERKDSSVAFYTQEHTVQIPAAGLGVLMIGPGTSITHAAILIMADCGVSMVWVGEDGCRFYAGGLGKSRSSRHIMRQAYIWSHAQMRMLVIHRLYMFRFKEPLPADSTLQQIRGFEGVRVREAYQQAAAQYNVTWHGRNYKKNSWYSADPINRALSAGAATLYGICHAGINATGYSPAIGFIHIGQQLSFVYDIADLYKTDILIPAAFAAARENPLQVEKEVRQKMRERIISRHLLPQIAKDLNRLFADIPIEEGIDDSADAKAMQETGAENYLWDTSGIISGGKNYADNDS